jgi:hypothetical protein
VVVLEMCEDERLGDGINVKAAPVTPTGTSESTHSLPPARMDNYLLELLIEGDKSTQAVTIPRTATVQELKELIRSMRGLDRFHLRDLEPFKVCHDHSPKWP